MNGYGQSDRFVVPANPLNKAAAAEAGEERERTKGNTAGETRPGRSAGPSVSSELDRVRQVARRDKEARFTALLHHVSLERLVLAYWDLSPKAAPGVDGVTWAAYGQDLVANLRDLHERVQQGATGRVRLAGVHPEGGRAAAAARHRHAGGQDRPAGRRRGAERHLRGGLPGFLLRVPARAQPAPGAGCAGGRDLPEKVNWVLDADIRDFFGQLDRDWLRRFLRHRIADERVLRLVESGWPRGSSRTGNGRRARQGHRRAAYVQLRINRLMNSAGLCAALAPWPW